MYMYIFGAILVLVIVWTIGSYVVIWSVEQPEYTVVEKLNKYEVREYPSYIIATTQVSGDYKVATENGFRLIADYIFGNNQSKQSIAMTSPVLESPTPNQAEKIAMTTPVLESETSSSTRTISFILPKKYTLETLPKPNNYKVTLIAIPTRKVAALRFTWYASGARMKAKKALLTSYLLRDNKVITGEPETARYNPPLSMPLALRNEVLIPIE